MFFNINEAAAGVPTGLHFSTAAVLTGDSPGQSINYELKKGLPCLFCPATPFAPLDQLSPALN